MGDRMKEEEHILEYWEVEALFEMVTTDDILEFESQGELALMKLWLERNRPSTPKVIE